MGRAATNTDPYLHFDAEDAADERGFSSAGLSGLVEPRFTLLEESHLTNNQDTQTKKTDLLIAIKP